MAQLVKNPPAMQETWVQSLGWEAPLEEGMATHSSILAWRIPMDRGAWRAIVLGVEESQTRLSDQAQHSTAQVPSDGEKVEIVAEFIFLGSKIPADGDCCHEIKRHLLFGRKAKTYLAYKKAETSLCLQKSESSVQSKLWFLQ